VALPIEKFVVATQPALARIGTKAPNIARAVPNIKTRFITLPFFHATRHTWVKQITCQKYNCG
jgi:hypothetical protein